MHGICTCRSLKRLEDDERQRPTKLRRSYFTNDALTGLPLSPPRRVIAQVNCQPPRLEARVSAAQMTQFLVAHRHHGARYASFMSRES